MESFKSRINQIPPRRRTKPSGCLSILPVFIGSPNVPALAGQTDLLIGVAALLVKVNGLKKMPNHIQDKMAAMRMAASTAYVDSAGVHYQCRRQTGDQQDRLAESL
jgi:hypothetical protein